MEYNLLVADDDDDDVLLLTKYLHGHNSSVKLTHVWNGAGIIQKLSEGMRPDLILVDSQMPIMNGQELLRQLRANSGWQHIPIVVWAGTLSEEDTMHFYQSGANSCVMKQDIFAKMDIFCRYWFELIKLVPASVSF
ncbi:response regulator [Spirosoma flavus]